MDTKSSSNNGRDAQSEAILSPNASLPKETGAPEEAIAFPESKSPEAVLETTLPLPLLKKDGAKDIYDLGEYHLAVYTDRAGVSGITIEGGMPQRGLYLARLAAYWLEKTKLSVPNHFEAYLQSADELQQFLREGESIELPENLIGRCIVFTKSDPLDIEFEIWGYLTGPAWKEYQESGTVFGIPQISGLLQSQCIPREIIVAFKSNETGTRKQLSDEEVIEITGQDLFDNIKTVCSKIYNDAQRTLRISGKFIPAYMKIMFDQNTNKARIAGDILTPDTTCYWDAQNYRVGGSHYNFESQTLRAWLAHTSWKHPKPLPQIPAEVKQQTAKKHRILCDRIIGK
jgi:phosphoribosylaminoimidazole-succinocarboxamide synthase